MTKHPDPTAFLGWLRTESGWQCVCSGVDALACWQILLERPEVAPRTVLPMHLRAQDGHCLQCGNALPRERWCQQAHCSAACAHIRNDLRSSASRHLRQRRRKEKTRGST